MAGGRPRLYVADIDEITGGEATDIYFKRTRKILEEAGLGDVWVRAEIHSYSLPRGYEWAVYAGLEEALAILEGRNVNVYSLPEGTLFARKYPLMIIEGPYREFVELETAVLGALRFSTAVATKAARIRLAAGDKLVLFFGLRSLHPALQPAADRAAYIGGVDGVSGALSKKYLGLEPRGTMPHALIIVFGDQREAWQWYSKLYGETIALVDTFLDERYEAVLAARTLGEKLKGVRLDTPGSRRGRMRDIVEEVRWALKLEGRSDVMIFVSGGLDEEQVRELRDVADGFGVGTSIAWPPNIDISMDIVEVMKDGMWKPITKRGKLPGARILYKCGSTLRVGLLGREPPCSGAEMLHKQYLDSGRLVGPLPGIEEIRGYVLEQLRSLDTMPPAQLVD